MYLLRVDRAKLLSWQRTHIYLVNCVWGGNVGDKQRTRTQERSSEWVMQMKEVGKASSTLSVLQMTCVLSSCAFFFVNILWLKNQIYFFGFVFILGTLWMRENKLGSSWINISRAWCGFVPHSVTSSELQDLVLLLATEHFLWASCPVEQASAASADIPTTLLLPWESEQGFSSLNPPFI